MLHNAADVSVVLFGVEKYPSPSLHNTATDFSLRAEDISCVSGETKEKKA